ncbi:MAG: NTPase [Anditalea sp.]
MKYISVLLFLFFSMVQGFGQPSPLEGFMEGKSVVLISAAPGAKPVMSWGTLAEKIHDALIEAGGDPVAYYELEDIIISEEKQAGYADAFAQRLIKNVITLTRKENAELSIHIMPFTQDKNIAAQGTSWSVSASNVDELGERITAIGVNRPSRNFLVIDVPEFGSGDVESKGSSPFLPRKPLNLDVFKLGVPLSGATGESSFLTTFRYDLLGKSSEQMLAEQQGEKKELENIFKTYYPYEVEFLGSSKTDAELINDRVQFVLTRLQGREGDLMKSMGVKIPDSIDTERIVVKYYIRFLVRDELYIGSVWDADPNWKVALINFIKNLQI